MISANHVEMYSKCTPGVAIGAFSATVGMITEFSVGAIAFQFGVPTTSSMFIGGISGVITGGMLGGIGEAVLKL